MYKGPSLTHYKFEFSPDNLHRCWEECKVKSDYAARRSAVDQFNQQNRWKKRGMSIIPIKYGVAFAESFLNQVRSGRHVCASSCQTSDNKHWCCDAGCSSGPRLQRRFCPGHSRRDGDGSGNPHQNATGAATFVLLDQSATENSP